MSISGNPYRNRGRPPPVARRPPPADPACRNRGKLLRRRHPGADNLGTVRISRPSGSCPQSRVTPRRTGSRARSPTRSATRARPTPPGSRVPRWPRRWGAARASASWRPRTCRTTTPGTRWPAWSGGSTTRHRTRTGTSARAPSTPATASSSTTTGRRRDRRGSRVRRTPPRSPRSRCRGGTSHPGSPRRSRPSCGTCRPRRASRWIPRPTSPESPEVFVQVRGSDVGVALFARTGVEDTDCTMGHRVAGVVRVWSLSARDQRMELPCSAEAALAAP